jgi:hypothetical protein
MKKIIAFATLALVLAAGTATVFTAQPTLALACNNPSGC